MQRLHLTHEKHPHNLQKAICKLQGKISRLFWRVSSPGFIASAEGCWNWMCNRNGLWDARTVNLNWVWIDSFISLAVTYFISCFLSCGLHLTNSSFFRHAICTGRRNLTTLLSGYQCCGSYLRGECKCPLFISFLRIGCHFYPLIN